MNGDLTTNPSLLLKIRDHRDHESWTLFVNLYAPPIYRFLKRQGLQDADAADLAQEVFTAVALWIDRLRYDPQRGMFRGWLFAIIRHKLYNHINRLQPPDLGSGDPVIQQRLEDEPEPEPAVPEDRVWDEEYEMCVLHWAADKVRTDFRDRTWQAFWQTSVEGRPADDVATELSMTTGAVWVAKCRVLKKLRDEIQFVEDFPRA